MSTSHVAEILLTSEQIQARISELAQQIEREHPGTDPIHLVCVLKGGFLFLSDLVRGMGERVTLDFIAVSSYGKGTTSSGEVRMLKDLDAGIEGRDVVIVEDIVDTGLTLTYLQEILRARNPRSLRTTCLLSKPSRRLVDVKVEYVGFEIPDKFVVGYGLDYAERYRNLPYIGVLGLD
ncbi:MAG: hypoxanthine phosphoribosyltransferase [Acidobacteria bacterium]|nr:hypoxanthine phosphoribosyltransferase [Acidobacteriota bacterium]